MIQLRWLVAEVRRAALCEAHSAVHFTEPTVIPTIRPDGKYRAIAQYPLRERVLSSLLAQYLRDAFDPLIPNTVYAFRSPKNGPITHHHAFHAVATYRRLHKGTVWVAESDIQGFFDCVHHDIARTAYATCTSKANELLGSAIDRRATALFNSVLDSYSFPETAIAQTKAFFRASHLTGQLKWADEALMKFYSNPMNEEIGIPQGGPLSGLLANLVLLKADQAVNKAAAPDDANRLYARYVDDMIAAHTSRECCLRMQQAYNRALTELRLPAHPATHLPYGKRFWHQKSKSPYPWAPQPENESTNSQRAVPWVGFVGYQIRFDCLVRVRPSSLKKELLKQRQEADKVIRLLLRQKRNNNIGARVSARQIAYRLRKRLQARSIGREPAWNMPPAEPTHSWCGGYQALGDHRIVVSQLRHLDRCREQQIRRVARVAEALLSVASTGKRIRGSEKYAGLPFSYVGQFVSSRPSELKNSSP
ncbi:MAG: hypothetical protein H6825_09130 [Planctomycetes bacterium]|nr:hypothetical protein [Planctomycetota bacterium]